MRRAAFRIFPRQTLSVRARPPHTGAPHPQPAAMRRRISFGESVAICRGLLYTGWCCGAPAAPAAQKRTRRGIEVVITGAPRKRFGSNPTWVRIPPSPPKQRAHAAHGPSALLLDRWDSKGGTENAAVRHFPALGSDGPQLCSLEGKQQEASAENPTLLREQAGRAHAAHGPSALLLDRWDSKGGTGEAPVEPRPAPGRTGKRLRRAERKQAAARAENPTLLREQAGRAHAAHGPSALLLDRWDSKGGTENAAVRHFPAPGASPRPGGAPSRGLAPPRGERAREQIRPAGGCPAGAARRAAAPCAQTSVSPPANPLRFRVTSFQASPANRRGSRPPRSPR